jgi:hypothetical protein
LSHLSAQLRAVLWFAFESFSGFLASHLSADIGDIMLNRADIGLYLVELPEKALPALLI